MYVVQSKTYAVMSLQGHRSNLYTSIERKKSLVYQDTVYPKKYAHGFVVLCFVVVMQSFIMNSHEVLIHIHQGCFAGTGAIVRLPQCQWSKPDGYGKISQCITTTKHSKAKTGCIFLGIYCKCYKLPCWGYQLNLPNSIQFVYSIHKFVGNISIPAICWPLSVKWRGYSDFILFLQMIILSVPYVFLI